MSEAPRSPRERILQEAAIEEAEVTYDPAQLDDPVVARLADAAEAAAAARAAGEATAYGDYSDPPVPPVWDAEMGAAAAYIEGGVQPEEPQEVITVAEVETQLTRLEQLQQTEMPTYERFAHADDALQGICLILAMGFNGDVQTMVLAALQRYRSIHSYG